jgi:RNA recognition motif-containing protein
MDIYIGNLPYDFDEEELVEMFEEYGEVKKPKIVRDRFTKASRGYGFIEIVNNDAAQKAIKDWNQGSIDGRIIKVRESKFDNKNKRKR